MNGYVNIDLYKNRKGVVATFSFSRGPPCPEFGDAGLPSSLPGPELERPAVKKCYCRLILILTFISSHLFIHLYIEMYLWHIHFLYLDSNVLARHFLKALLRKKKQTNQYLAGWELFLCPYSCKYRKLWHVELMSARKIQTLKSGRCRGRFLIFLFLVLEKWW